MSLFSFYYVFFTVKCHYGNNLYGSKNQEKTDQIHAGELGSQKEFRLPCVAIRKIPANAHTTEAASYI